MPSCLNVMLSLFLIIILAEGCHKNKYKVRVEDPRSSDTTLRFHFLSIQHIHFNVPLISYQRKRSNDHLHVFIIYYSYKAISNNNSLSLCLHL